MQSAAARFLQLVGWLAGWLAGEIISRGDMLPDQT